MMEAQRTAEAGMTGDELLSDAVIETIDATDIMESNEQIPVDVVIDSHVITETVPPEKKKRVSKKAKAEALQTVDA